MGKLKHTPETRARIGAASRARNSAAIANAARSAAAQARKAALPPKPPKRVLTEAERKAIDVMRAAKWAAENRARSRAINRAWYERNRETINAKQREQNGTAERKEFMRGYAPKHRAENPEMYRTYGHNRRARLLDAGEHTEAEWLDKVAEYRGACAYCFKAKPLAREHDVPLARGGSNTIENIVPACWPCNSRKGTLTGDEFRARLKGERPATDGRWSEQLAAARANSPTHKGRS